MKPLPKTMRRDHRYLVLEIDSDLDREKALSIVRESVKSYSGEKGLVNINPKLLDSESEYSESKVVVRINKEFEDAFRASLALSSRKICTVNVSGSSTSI